MSSGSSESNEPGVADPEVERTMATLLRGTVQVVSEEELRRRLAAGRPLRVKLGVDPTAPDIHLGHAVALQKLRQFQRLGHQVVLIIGDFTAQIGDPSGRNSTRPPLTHEEVLANARTFTEQAFLILDRERTEVVYNGEWFARMTFGEIIRLNASVTLQQMLQREDFKNRVAAGQEVRLHEIQYPVMQGWDSVMVRADVEIGGSDQLFNILVGRDLQKSNGMEPQVVITLPLLEGLDGVKKMSKSLNNYIGLTDPPEEMFGKAMSLSDEMMPRYFELTLGCEMPEGLHPMEAKKRLAGGLVAMYHDDAAAATAREKWEARFSQRDLAVDAPVFEVGSEDPGLLAVVLRAFATAHGQQRSGSEVRRLIQQGSIQWNGVKVADPKATPDWGAGGILKLDKRRSVRIEPRG